MSNERNHLRALRYRTLALAELDPVRAGLLNRIADEAERGILCVVEQPMKRAQDAGPPRTATSAKAS